MIEDKFAVIKIDGDMDDATITTKCKSCSYEFIVKTNILKPQNCSHVLGRSMTVTCPTCKVAGVTTGRESRIKILETNIKAIQEQIDNKLNKQKLNFVCHKSDLVKHLLHLTCNHCSCAFSADTYGTLNSELTGGALTIKCPQCHAVDITNMNSVFEQLAVATLMLDLKEAELDLAELKKGEADGNQQISAPF